MSKFKTEIGENRNSQAEEYNPFKSHAEFFTAVGAASAPAAVRDDRLNQIMRRAASGLSESIASDGGFLVQTDVAREIQQAAFGDASLPSRCSRYALAGNSLTMPGLAETSRADGSRHGGVQGYWHSEADLLTGSKPSFREINLELSKLVVLVYATAELLEDASSLDTYIKKVAGDELAFKLADALINGDGAGKPLGILNSPALVAVAKETSQTADTIVYENVLNMWSRMPASSRKNAVWHISQDAEPQLNKMSLTVGDGGSAVYLPSGGASSAPYSTLFGRPVIPLEQCATLGDQGDIILADWSQYLFAEKRGGVRSDVSMHVRFLYDESVFRFVVRVDGQPLWDSPITPYKGTATISPFITLAARA
jgi:HK97 family phage major capsid protein